MPCFKVIKVYLPTRTNDLISPKAVSSPIQKSFAEKFKCGSANHLKWHVHECDGRTILIQK